MCRSIKRLRPAANDPAGVPATPEEIEAAARQFVKKISGFQRPSPANQAAFERAVADIAQTSTQLLDGLVLGARR